VAFGEVAFGEVGADSSLRVAFFRAAVSFFAAVLFFREVDSSVREVVLC
jgi:hypothetical protein